MGMDEYRNSFQRQYNQELSQYGFTHTSLGGIIGHCNFFLMARFVRRVALLLPITRGRALGGARATFLSESSGVEDQGSIILRHQRCERYLLHWTVSRSV